MNTIKFIVFLKIWTFIFFFISIIYWLFFLKIVTAKFKSVLLNPTDFDLVSNKFVESYFSSSYLNSSIKSILSGSIVSIAEYTLSISFWGIILSEKKSLNFSIISFFLNLSLKIEFMNLCLMEFVSLSLILLYHLSLFLNFVSLRLYL